MSSVPWDTMVTKDAEHGHCVESGCSPCTGAEFVQELQLPIRNAKANATKPGEVKQNFHIFC